MGLLLSPKASRIIKMLRYRQSCGREMPTEYRGFRDYVDVATGRELNPMQVELLTGMVMIRWAQLMRAQTRSGG